MDAQSRFKSTVEAQQVEAWESWQPTAQLRRLKAVRFADTLAAIWRSPGKSRDTLVPGGCWIFSLIQNHSSLRPSRHFWNSLSRPRHRLPNFKAAGNLLRRIMPFAHRGDTPNNLPASVLVEKRNRSGSVPLGGTQWATPMPSPFEVQPRSQTEKQPHCSSAWGYKIRHEAPI